MANNYLQFSFQLEGPEWTKEAREHLGGLIDKGNEDPDTNYICQYEQEDAGMWLYAEEGGDPDTLARLIKKTMRKFKMTEAVAFTWAETCDKMRVDEFSGGGVCIKPTSLKWFSGGMAQTCAYAYNNRNSPKE